MSSSEKKVADQINQIIDDEFQQIEKKIQRHFCDEVSISIVRKHLIQHVPKLVEGSAQVLFESVLTYKIQEASELLKNTTTKNKNNFYSKNFREQLQRSFIADPLNFHIDKRFISGGIFSLLTLSAIGNFILNLFNKSIVGFSTFYINLLVHVILIILGALISYYLGPKWEKTKLTNGVKVYIEQSKKKMKSWLNDIRNEFDNKLLEFSAKDNSNIEG